MKRLRSFLTLLCAALLLGACAEQAEPRTQVSSEAGVVEAVNSLIRDLATLQDPGLAEAAVAAAQLPLGAPGCPEVDLVFDFIGFSSRSNLQALSHSGGTVLARGSYSFDAETGTCTKTADGDELVLSYPYETSMGELAEAELHIDWDVDAATLDVANPAGDLVEVPTDMKLQLMADGDKLADAEVDLSWYNAAECGTGDGVLEPTSVRASGQIGTLSFTNVGYNIDKNSLDIGGNLSASQGLDVDISLGVKGKTEREACYIKTFEVKKGDFALGIDSTIFRDSRSFDLDVKLSDAQFEDFPVDLGDMDLGMMKGLSAVTLKNGTLSIDDTKAVKFSGVLDDSNGNGVSGENVTLDFASGENTDLESFLTENEFGVTFPSED